MREVTTKMKHKVAITKDDEEAKVFWFESAKYFSTKANHDFIKIFLIKIYHVIGNKIPSWFSNFVIKASPIELIKEVFEDKIATSAN